MNTSGLLLAIMSVCCLASSAAAQTTWTFDDAHSNLHFSLTQFLVADIEGSVVIKEARLTTTAPDFAGATIYILADMRTIDTDNDARDEHLRTADFFDTEKYPDLTFESQPFQKIDSGKYRVTGKLTFHGITREAVMDVDATKVNRHYDGKEIVGFKANGEISRTAFGISTDTPDAVLSDKVNVHANVIFVKE